jgi:glycosyltransferase involved in cell wall biosynthesis
MRILYLHQHFSTPKGAAGIRSYAMAQALIANGHEVTMVCGRYSVGGSGLDTPFLRGQRSGVVDGIRVVEFDLQYANSDGFLKRTWVFLTFAARSIGLALHEDYDLVFATTTPLTASIPALFARWIRRKRFVFEVRDLWPELPRAMGAISNPLVLGAMSFLEWMSYRSAHRLVGLSPGIVDGIERVGVAREKITLIPNGCDLDIFDRRPRIVPWAPYGVLPDDLVAVYTGTHGLANGLGAVLDAGLVLKERGRRDIKLVLVGDGKLKAELMTRAAHEEIENVVFQEPVSKSQLAGLLSRADLGMQILSNVPAFYYGTSPNKFFDYISAGLPVLVNYPGWLAEMIHRHGFGWVVPPEDPVGFADALENAADNRDRLSDLGGRAFELARSQFDRLILGEKFVDWLEECPS